MKLRFTHGVEFDTSGELRAEVRHRRSGAPPLSPLLQFPRSKGPLQNPLQVKSVEDIL